MKQIYYAWRTLLHSRGASVVKVVSVGIGLGMATLLLACVAYTYSYDHCFKEYDRLYQQWMEWEFDGQKYPPSQRCVGKLAEGALNDLADIVESASSGFSSRTEVQVGDKYHAAMVFYTDSLIFRTLGVNVVTGDAVKELAQPNVAFVSDAMAAKMFGDTVDPIGKRMVINELDVVVRGVFKAIPANTTRPADIMLSLPSLISRGYMIYNSWEGGDSWFQYVRLRPEVDLDKEALSARFTDMYQKHAPDRDGLMRRIVVRPITDTILEYDAGRKTMTTVMWALAVVLIGITVLNYVLISLASLSRRAKSVGVQKCCGAGRGSIFALFIYETAIVLMGAMSLMCLLLWFLRDFVETTLGTPLSTMLAPERLWIVAVVAALLVCVGGALPAVVFSRIPVTHVFRRFTDRRSGWKKTLLAVQFAGVAMILSLLCVVSVQYYHVLDLDLGYNPERVAIGWHGAGSAEEQESLVDYYSRLPMVEAVATSQGNPVNGYSGEAVLDESGRMRFSTRYDGWDRDYAAMMGFSLLHGRYPSENGEVAVNQSFVADMNWNEADAVGRRVPLGEETLTVVGVLHDFTINDLFAGGRRQFMMYPLGGRSNCIHLRLKEPFAESLERLNATVAADYPTERLVFHGMEKMIADRYADVRLFRDLALMASITILFIALMGLIGYVGNELQRRSKEIAVRKINGAESGGIIEMMLGDVMRVALPSVILGSVVAAMVGVKLSALFKESALASNLWAWYVVTAIVLLLLIALCVVLQTCRIANENPVESLRSE